MNMHSDRLWLEVPYEEKDAAKSAGAWWDSEQRAWYAPRPGMTSLQRWAGRPPLPERLPGEDRSFGGTDLFVDLVPDSCWFTNVRSCVDKRDWDRLRKMIYRRANQVCEICGTGRDFDAEVWLEAHERWHYDSATKTQRLVRLICLCTPCHEATHFGLAEINGHRDHALNQLIAVNGWSRRHAEQHVSEAFNEWRRRSAIDWHLDLSILADADIDITPPPEASHRRAVSDQSLNRTTAAAGPAPIAPRPPQGWYADPAGRFTHRWWNGVQWTHDVAVNGQHMIDNSIFARQSSSAWRRGTG